MISGSGAAEAPENRRRREAGEILSKAIARGANASRIVVFLCAGLLGLTTLWAASGAGNRFLPDSVAKIDIEMSPESMESLRLDRRKDVRAAVRFDGSLFLEVGVHLKGFSGSFRPLDDKPSWTLDFERFRDGPRWKGFRKIHLNNSVEDPSYLKEKIGSEFFASAGVPAPMVGYAVVALNGRRLGLYVLKEGFTREFLSRHFEDPNGSLYDPEQKGDIDQNLKLILDQSTHGEELALRSLREAALEPDLVRRWQRLQEALDVDRMLTFMALEIMICHWDGYCLAKNNYRLCQDAPGRGMVFLPTGMDQIFVKSDMRWNPNMTGLVARCLMETPEGRAGYEARFKRLFNIHFSPRRIGARIKDLIALLHPFLGKREYREILEEANALIRWLDERAAFLRKQIDRSGPLPLVFKDSVADLVGWEPSEASPSRGRLSVGLPGETSELWILATSNLSTGWRTTRRLRPGTYRFEGKARVEDVKPLRFGVHHGVCLRVSGRRDRSASLLGTTDWTRLQIEFDVPAPGAEMTLICELRASSGRACFQEKSLKLIRLQ